MLSANLSIEREAEQTFEHFREGKRGFESGERCTEAVVRSVAEGEVFVGGSPDVEAVGFRKN